MTDKVQFVENFVEVYVFNRAVSNQHDEISHRLKTPLKVVFYRRWVSFHLTLS
jgi:hypothetical protein